MAYVYRVNPYLKKKNPLFYLSANSIIILLNILFFIIFTAFIYYNSSYIDYIAIKPESILSGKYLWTFITSMFMHGGIFHLFANMLSLFFIGGLVQKLIGAKRYFYFYLISGLFASLLFVLSSFFFKINMSSYAVGASGAIFGLVGFLVIITPNLPVYVMFIPIPIKMKYAGPGILVLLWLISLAGNIPIGNTAHFGGLICGLIYGIYLRKKYYRKTKMIEKIFS
jgi:membrane associated rhomboid family serine protease